MGLLSEYYSQNTRTRMLFAVGMGLFVISGALIWLARWHAAVHTAAAAQSRFEAHARANGRILSNAFRDSLAMAELALLSKGDEDRVLRGPLILASGLLHWEREEISQLRRVDNADALKSKSIDPRLVTDAIQALKTEFLNAGAAREQLHSGVLGADTPVLFVLAPFRASSEAKAVFAVLDAQELFKQIGPLQGTTTSLIDRFGTVLLHPELERAVHRESVARNPLVKNFFAAPADSGTLGSYNEANSGPSLFGSFFRLPFAGAALLIETPLDNVQYPIRNMTLTLVLGAALSIVVILGSTYLITLVFMPARQRKKRAEELKLAG